MFQKDYRRAEAYFESALEKAPGPQLQRQQQSSPWPWPSKTTRRRAWRRWGLPTTTCRSIRGTARRGQTYGWVLFKLKRYEDAEKQLQAAVSGSYTADTGDTDACVLAARGHEASNKLSNNSSQQVEFLAEVLNSEDKVFDLSVGPGFLHEYAGTNDLLGRAIIGRCFSSWKIYGNVLVEKAFAKNRDEFDLFLTAGLSYKVSSSFHLGFEAVGQGLEGIWDATEAEGGATVFIG